MATIKIALIGAPATGKTHSLLWLKSAITSGLQNATVYPNTHEPTLYCNKTPLYNRFGRVEIIDTPGLKERKQHRIDCYEREVPQIAIIFGTDDEYYEEIINTCPRIRVYDFRSLMWFFEFFNDLQ